MEKSVFSVQCMKYMQSEWVACRNDSEKKMKEREIQRETKKIVIVELTFTIIRRSGFCYYCYYDCSTERKREKERQSAEYDRKREKKIEKEQTIY